MEILGFCHFYKCDVTKNKCNSSCPEKIRLRENVDGICEALELRLKPVKEKKEQGRKFDDDKLPYDLIPPECLEELAKVLAYGAKKYSANNWQNVEPFNERYYSALMRHLENWRKGEQNDPESGLNHLSHVLANAVFLLWKELKNK